MADYWKSASYKRWASKDVAAQMKKADERDHLLATTSLDDIEMWLVELTKEATRRTNNVRRRLDYAEQQFVIDTNAQYDDRMRRGFTEFPLSGVQLQRLHKLWERHIASIARSITEE